MSTLAKIALVFLGLALLLPGLCFLFFGGVFVMAWFAKGLDMYGFYRLAPWQLLIGAALTLAAFFVFKRLADRSRK